MNMDFNERILALARVVGTPSTLRLTDAAQQARELAQALHDEGEAWLVAGATADQLAAGLRFAQAAIEVGPARLALETAAAWSANEVEPALLERIVAFNLRLVRSRLLSALKPLAHLGHDETPPPRPTGSAAVTAQSAQAPGAVSNGAAMDLRALRNIATYHRAHERYYTTHFTHAAVELYVEANRLRAVAEKWMGAATEQPDTGIDYSAAAYQAAGCVDLNVLSAIPAIGVLFMEGEGEPSEIRVMKAKLQALTAAWSNTGPWLAQKMEAAWQREQAMFTPQLVHLAQARFNTIATNWRGAREMELAGRMLGHAVAALQGMDLRPASIRSDRQRAGRRLLDAAWMIAMAAQIDARSGAELAENDRNWSAYLDGLSPLIEGTQP